MTAAFQTVAKLEKLDHARRESTWKADMADRIEKTKEQLAKHHRDGKRFAQLMKEGFDKRFDESFWALWRQWIEPAYGAPAVVIDLGAGPGMFVKALTERFPGIRAFGIECAPWMLEAAEPLPPESGMVPEDLHDPKLPFADGSVDAAMASVVLHEMDQPVRLLQEVHRCMKPGGRLLVLDWVRAPLEVYLRQQTEEAKVFDRSMSVEELDDLFVHFMEHNRFSREDLVYLLNRTGFAVLDSQVTREGRYARIVAERW
jgi:ubiquinone/menaquinone biosynthesis C-methylase UbiE